MKTIKGKEDELETLIAENQNLQEQAESSSTKQTNDFHNKQIEILDKKHNQEIKNLMDKITKAKEVKDNSDDELKDKVLELAKEKKDNADELKTKEVELDGLKDQEKLLKE